MNAIVLVLIGMLVVIAGIVVLRLHAFLALILAAILVAALTPSQRLADSESASHFIGKVEKIEGEPVRVHVSFKKAGTVQFGDRVDVLKADPVRGGYLHLSELRIEEITPGSRTIIAAYHGPHDGHAFAGDSQANVVDVYIAPGDPLVYPQDLKSALEPGVDGIGSRVAAGFGKTCVSVAILIAMAAVVGQCLLRSGAAERIVNTALATVGEKRAPVAFTFSGFLLAIPVFFDTVFLLLIPLGKELRIKTGKNYTLYVMSIVAGGTMAHSLVPPTPGPLLAASQLNVPVGTMMLGGTIVGLFTVSAGLCYAYWLNKRLEIPLRETADAPTSSSPSTSESRVLPPMWFALLPIALPVVLIAANSILSQTFKGEADPPAWWLGIEPMLSVVGDKNIAITLADDAAVRQRRRQGHAIARAESLGIRRRDHPHHRGWRRVRRGAPADGYRRGVQAHRARRLAGPVAAAIGVHHHDARSHRTRLGDGVDDHPLD